MLLLFNGFLDGRDNGFMLLSGQFKDFSFGTLFGLMLYFATPILFLLSVITYSISQINKNATSISSMQEQQRKIYLLKATLNAKADTGATSKEITQDIKHIATTIQNATLEQFTSQKTQENTKEEARYIEKLANKQLMAQLTKLLQTKK